jgi:hypothetical protein
MILPVWVKPAIAAVALAGAFSAGWVVNGWRWEAKQAEALRDAQIAFHKQLAQQQDEAEQYEQSREQARQDHLAREEQVRIIYRDRVVDPGCEPPDDAKRVLDEALRDANARAAGEPRSAMP